MPPSETRRKILECAIRLLGNHGPNALSASALAKELGISKATVFHHFPTLAEIPHEAFELMFEDFVDWQPPKSMTVKQLLDALGTMTFAALEGRRDFLRAYYVFFASAMFDDRLRTRLANYLDTVNARITAHFVAVGLPKNEARNYARLALLVLDGTSLHMFASDNGTELERAWTAFCKMVVHETTRKEK